MEQIKNFIKTIQDHRKQNVIKHEVINQVYNEINSLIKIIYPKLFTKRENLVEDLNYIFNKKEKMILNGRFIDDFSRDLYNFECFLTAILHDYKLKVLIEKQKITNIIDPILLKCYEVIGKIFNYYLYFWSCDRHYIHRNDLEKILELLSRRKDLLNEQLDIYFLVERKSRYNLENKPDEYIIELNEFQIRIHMSGDSVGFIFMDQLDHSQIFEFLDSIKQKLIENERSEIYQKIEDINPNYFNQFKKQFDDFLDSIKKKMFENNHDIVFKRIEEKYPDCYFQLKKQLDELNFRKICPILSPSGELWLKIIGKLFGLLRVSAKDKKVLREQAQSWKSEEKDMSPWTNQWLEVRFGNKHTIKPQISDGHSDHFIDNIALEDKLIRTNENLNNNFLIEEKYKKEKRQVKREGILSGFQILLIVDIRTEVKEGKLDAKRIPECFKIFYEDGYWTAAFLFQAFTRTPSKS